MRLTTLPLIRIKEASTPCLEELGLWWPSRICLRGIVWADSGSDVRFWQILLQKSGTTGHRGWRELLELAACYPLPNKGMF